MRKTLTKIGPAMLSGGLSTFVAFMLLSMSKSIVFISFFKIFFLVVVFGLFHGLLFLPVILSIIGPPSSVTKHIQPPPLTTQQNLGKSAKENEAFEDDDGLTTISSRISSAHSEIVEVTGVPAIPGTPQVD